jgi:hypothetical protein
MELVVDLDIDLDIIPSSTYLQLLYPYLLLARLELGLALRLQLDRVPCGGRLLCVSNGRLLPRPLPPVNVVLHPCEVGVGSHQVALEGPVTVGVPRVDVEVGWNALSGCSSEASKMINDRTQRNALKSETSNMINDRTRHNAAPTERCSGRRVALSWPWLEWK